MDLLLDEYRESMRSLKKMREQAPEEDQKIFGNMVSSLEFATNWLKTGFMPERSKAYGSYPSEALLNLEEDWGKELIDPFSRGAFEEVENRIDAERRRAKRAENQ